MDRNRKVQGVGPARGGKGRGRKLASPSFLLSEPFAQTVHLMMSNPRCREAMCLRLQLAQPEEAVRPCLGLVLWPLLGLPDLVTY